MNLLLDTQILVWLVNGDRRLTVPMRDAIVAADGLFVSAVTAFEYTDLLQRKRLPITEGVAELARRFNLQIEALPKEAWEMIARLPLVHSDPVDRMLIAHALCSGMTLLTADKTIRQYPVDTI